MPYNIHILAEVEKDIGAIPEPDHSRVIAAIDGLTGNPRPPGSLKMSGYKDLYRLRVGRYRIVYEIRDKELFVIIFAAAIRGRVYQIAKRRIKK